MAPRKRICLTGEACSVGKVQEQTVMDRVNCTMVNSKFKEEKGTRTRTGCCCAEFSINSRNLQIRSNTHRRTQAQGSRHREKPGETRNQDGTQKEGGETQSSNRTCCIAQILFLRPEYNLSLDFFQLRTHHVLLDYIGSRSPCS